MMNFAVRDMFLIGCRCVSLNTEQCYDIIRHHVPIPGCRIATPRP